MSRRESMAGRGDGMSESRGGAARVRRLRHHKVHGLHCYKRSVDGAVRPVRSSDHLFASSPLMVQDGFQNVGGVTRPGMLQFLSGGALKFYCANEEESEAVGVAGVNCG